MVRLIATVLFLTRNTASATINPRYSSIHATRIYPHDMSEKLVGDIGGTNARLALLDANGQPADPITYSCGDFPGLGAAIEAFMAERNVEALSDAVIAVATPVTGDLINLTNNHWAFSRSAMQKELGLAEGCFQVVNDFTALALSVPFLSPEDVRKIGPGEAKSGKPIAVIGPGTGLGVSGIVPTAGGGWVALQGEGGHVSIGVRTDREMAIHDVFLSGEGLENIAGALRQIDGLEPLELTPARISARGLSGEDPVCEETLNIFVELLGSCAGNLALTLGSEGGVYIGGGIVPRLGDWFEQSNFREQFAAKGRMSEYLAHVPTYVIVAAYPALIGAASLLNRADSH